MSLQQRATSSRSHGSNIGYGSLGYGSMGHMHKDQVASNHEITKLMAKASSIGDWVKYNQLQTQLSF
tara:strand:- start:817 stop:1017 length:201 start_codon:yes stop_codon:yes gene_type:complete